jgi:hypothetical protein
MRCPPLPIQYDETAGDATPIPERWPDLQFAREQYASMYELCNLRCLVNLAILDLMMYVLPQDCGCLCSY